MRKINSIGYGHKVLLIIGCFLFLIPVLSAFTAYMSRLPASPVISKVSMTIGILLLAAFAGLLAIELKQDKRLARHYAENRNIKILLSSGNYECQACGNCLVEPDDRFCSICKINFKNSREVSQ